MNNSIRAGVLLTFFGLFSVRLLAASNSYVVVWGNITDGLNVLPSGLTNVVSVAGGHNKSLALRSDGSVVAWGCCSSWTNIPSGVSNVVAIAAGYTQVLALKNNGSVVAWGANPYGETNVPADLTNVIAIAAGSYHNVALRSNGTVVTWGYSWGSVPSGLTNVVAIGASYNNSLALKGDGTLQMWGPYGSDTLPPSNLSNVVAISGTRLALKNDGTVIAWGNNACGQTNIPANLTNAIAIAGNGGHNLAIKPDGRLVAWGCNGYGQANIPPGLSNVTAIAVGENTSLAVVSMNDGTPVITSPPMSQSVYSGANVTFTASAEGTPTPNYQWQFNGTNLPGTSSPSLTLTNVQLADSGTYRLTASNLLGSATSLSAVLAVSNSAPIIIFPLRNQTKVMGESVTLDLPYPAEGSLPLSYQWRFNKTNISGATNSALTITNLQPTNEGNYSLEVSNLFGTLTTTNAYLTIVDVDLGEALDSTNLVWVTSDGAPWRPEYVERDYVARSGFITNNQSSALQAGVMGPGTLKFRWTVSSQPALDYLSFSVNGVEQKRISGTTIWATETFYVGAGAQNLQWTFTKGATGSAGQNAGWVNMVTFTNTATLPTITTQPMNKALIEGSNVTFSVSAYGSPPLSYQWQVNGFDIASATNSLLTLSNMQAGNAGTYRAVATNPYGSTVSSEATLFIFAGSSQPHEALDRWYCRSTNQLQRVRFVGGLFIGLGDNGVLMTSPDGTVWTSRNSGTTASLQGVAFGSGLLPEPTGPFVVVGTGGTILTSGDGTNWSSAVVTSQDLNDVAWNTSQGGYVATATAWPGQPNVFYSANGINWHGFFFPQPPTGPYYYVYSSSITVVGGQFIVAGGVPHFADIWKSTTGINWTYVGSSDQVVTGMASGNGRTIMVGVESAPRVSTDNGASWFRTSGTGLASGDLYACNDITYGNGTFLVASEYLYGDFGKNGLTATLDGMNWSPKPVLGSAMIKSVAFGNGTFVAICSEGVYPAGIYQSEKVTTPLLAASVGATSNAVRLSISGEIGRSYWLQTSTNLSTWNDLWHYTNALPTVQFDDPMSARSKQLFYRVVSP